MLTLSELKDALIAQGQNLNEEEILKIIRDVDYAGNGKINYSEFLVATVEIKRVLTYDRLWALFKYFDTDSSGYITQQNLRDAFAKSGKMLTDEQMKEIMDKHDLEKNGVLSFDEFRRIFFTAKDQQGLANRSSDKSPPNSIRKLKYQQPLIASAAQEQASQSLLIQQSGQKGVKS